MSGGAAEIVTLQRETLAQYSAETIAKGSKSFALASLFFEKDMRADAQMLYSWCRHCDDVIDGQDLGGDAPDGELGREEVQRRLTVLREKTKAALDGHPSGDPPFEALREVAIRRNLPRDLPFDLLAGFAIDAEGRAPRTKADLMDYCYGVAGVVGVMMAIVMGVPPDDEETLDRACDLGLAFQLTNISRDVLDDARGGRVYLPAESLAAQGLEQTPLDIGMPEHRAAVARVVAALLDDAERYYASATGGVRHLPLRAAAAVAAARNIYRAIGRRVRRQGADAWNERTVISSTEKTALALAGFVSGAGRSAVSGVLSEPSRDGLWNRPRRPR